MDVAITFIKDEFGHKVLPYLRREELVTLVMCAVGFILGIPYVTKVGPLTRLTTSAVFSVFTQTLIPHPVPQGGIYVFQLMESYTAVQSLVFLALCEVVAVSWIFGKNLLFETRR